MLKDLIKVRDKVEYLLEKYPATRNSDKKLWLLYNATFNNLKTVLKTGNINEFKKFILDKNTPVFESLSRARRKIQENRPELSGKKKDRLQEAEKVKEYLK